MALSTHSLSSSSPQSQRKLQPLAGSLPLALLTLCATAASAGSPAPHHVGSAPAIMAAQPGYGSLPLSFEENQGQTAAPVRFTASGRGYSIFFTNSEAVLSLSRPDSRNGDVLRLSLENSRENMPVSGKDQLPGTANYFLGSEPAKWHTNLPTYGKVEYAGVYPGIDLVYYGQQRQLEYDFIVAPNASPGAIHLHVEGAKNLELTRTGEASISAANGQVTFHHPVVYQENATGRHAVEGHFALLSPSTLGFEVGAYDHSLPLIIDPTLAYSTYLGGSSGDQGTGIAVDKSGDAYVTGSTASTDFPTTSGAFQRTNKAAPSGQYNIFVTKFKPSGNQLVYSTYLGGTNDDEARGIAVGNNSQAFIVGSSTSANYPVTSGVFQNKNRAASNDGPNIVVTQLNASGTGLVYSTYLGGTNYDIAAGIAIDSDYHAYVTGEAASYDFPVTSGAYKTTNPDGACVFVSELNIAGSALLYSTFIGGNSDDHSAGIALDSSKNAYVAGYTESTTYPTTSSAFQKTNHSGGTSGFVTKLNSSGSALVYSTYLGGSTSGDQIHAIAVDPKNNAYVAGTAASHTFPITSGAYKTVDPSGSTTSFITKLSTSGSSLVYSTFFGGTDSRLDQINGIAVSSNGDAFVTGAAYSSDFPITSHSYQTTNKATGNNTSNAFFSELNAAGDTLFYSSFLGGSGNSDEEGDIGNSIALDSANNAYLAGTTYSTNFPLRNHYQLSNGNPSLGTAFVSKFALVTTTTTSLVSSKNPQAEGSTVTFTANVAPTTGPGVPTGTVSFSVNGTVKATVTLNGGGNASYSTSSLKEGSYTIKATYSGSTTYSTSNHSLTQKIEGS